MTAPSIMTVVVLFGPALPGRDLLQHTLERSLPAGTQVLVGEFPTSAERKALARAFETVGARAVYVAREPTPAHARHEVFRHFAGMPATFGELRWRTFEQDSGMRQRAGSEVHPLLVVRGDEPVDEITAAIRAMVGPGGRPAQAAPRVLVVDDDRSQVSVVRDALLTLGCTVATALSAEDAVALAESQPFDLVLADQRMPGASGTELAALLSAIQPEVRVVIVTGHGDEAVRSIARDPAVDLVLQKPLAIADLVHVIDEMVTPRASDSDQKIV